MLVSHQFLNNWPSSHVLALVREFSDHSPILLQNSIFDYGPVPFKFYNSWILNKDFESVLCNSWSSSGSWVNSTKAIVFKKKLQLLKLNLKDWRKVVNSLETASATSLREKISSIDIKAEIGPLTSHEVITRAMLVNDLGTLEYGKAKDLRQKSKSKWALEGDENSRFFHGIINNKINRSRINGLNIQGSWVTDPTCIKSHILHSFELKYSKDTTPRPSFSSNLFKQISSNSALWCKVIRSIHGPQGGLHDASLIRSKSGPWYRIAKLKEDLLNDYGINLPLIFKKKIGNGESTRFWLDNWLGGPTLKETFPHIFRLDNQPNCLVCDRVPDTTNGPSDANTLSPNTPVHSSNIYKNFSHHVCCLPVKTMLLALEEP
ncbi:cytochrome P450 [Artemisia annua]|uniref:Cytochrome P450 n=1 Tax=Artemisia annua TaxID=35608 RepID=A0A2U1LHP8_ARTAN|nr:cytochrome P450 [Artemisia annua]